MFDVFFSLFFSSFFFFFDFSFLTGTAKKERGNFWFSRNEYNSAISCYRSAVDFLDAQEDEMKYLHEFQEQKENVTDKDGKLIEKIKLLIELRAHAYNNLAAAQMKTEAFEQALSSVNSSLLLNGKNVKALYRKGKILAEQGNLSDAIDAMKEAILLEPSSRSLQSELNKLASLRKEELASERKLYQKMLQVTPQAKSKIQSSNGKVKSVIKTTFYNSGNWSTLFLQSTAAAALIVVLSIVFYHLYTGSSSN